jgi:serine protease Do
MIRSLRSNPSVAPRTSIAAMILAAGLAGLGAAAAVPPIAPTPASVETPAPAFIGQDPFDAIRTLEELRALERAVVDVGERARPSVVLLRWGSGGSSAGSAVIIGKDGLLATCGHVGRRPGREVTALLADGTELTGRTLGQVLSDGVDCGLVQLETEGRELPAAPVGTTRGLAQGDWVVALGYTQGLTEAVRPALLRAGRVLYLNERELYLDAPIDAGDSGGPSFNLRGEVVGLNARCGRLSWQNVATPIDLLSERMEALKAQVELEDQPEDAVDAKRARPSGLGSPVDDAGGKSTVERTVPLDDRTGAARASTVRIHVDGTSVAYGIVIDAERFVVTKASQLITDRTIEIEVPGGDRLIARPVARDTAADVVLLRTERPLAQAGNSPLQAVQWAPDAFVEPGAVLITPRGFGVRATLGFAAIEARESEADSLDGMFTGGYLGVQTRTATKRELDRAGADRAVAIQRVLPDTAASKAGLRPGQLILSLGGVEIGTPAELRAALRKRAAGDATPLTVVEGEAASEVEVVLGKREPSPRGPRRGNTVTAISSRSSGFGRLLPHDAVTEPTEMGGPVVDLDGRVVGMNIARFDRTATHAIGADRMAELCERLVKEAMAPAKSDETAKPASPAVAE